MSWTCAALLAASACSKPNDSGTLPPTESASVERLAPVPPPAALAATLVIAKPEFVWERARALAGAPGALLPKTLPLFATALLELPRELALSVEPSAPIVGALLESAAGSGMVLGFRLESGSELLARLSTGSDARYSARRESATSIVRLEPLSADKKSQPALGVLGNYLLIAANPALLSLGGPFVARSLPRGPPPREGVVLRSDGAALSGALVALLRRSWASQRERIAGVTSPTPGQNLLADPPRGLGDTALDVFADVLESADELRVVIEPLEARVEVAVELVPKAEGAAKQLVNGLSIGDTSQFLSLPQQSALAVVSRSSAESRAASVNPTSERLRVLFGSTLSGAEAANVRESFRRLSMGRGDVLACALLAPPDSAFVLDTQLADAASFEAGLAGVWRALGFKAVAERFRPVLSITGVRHDATRVAGIAEPVRRARFSAQFASGRAAQQSRQKPEHFEFLWVAREGTGYGALAAAPSAALAERIAGAQAGRLTADPDVRAAAERVGKSAALVVLVDPIRLGLFSSSERAAAPFVASLGRTRRAGWLRVEAPNSAVAALLSGIADD